MQAVGIFFIEQKYLPFRPIVIPLLADYVVAEGFVSSRDFLIGLVSSPI